LERRGNEFPVAVYLLGERYKFGDTALSGPFEPSAQSKAGIFEIVLPED
jgi:hypothetical protein